MWHVEAIEVATAAAQQLRDHAGCIDDSIRAISTFEDLHAERKVSMRHLVALEAVAAFERKRRAQRPCGHAGRCRLRTITSSVVSLRDCEYTGVVVLSTSSTLLSAFGSSEPQL